jgi:succinate dehydrogenase / fumarate reductase flavoprotein subunit
MEFYQYHPTGVIWPQFLAGRPVSEGVRSEGGRLYNALGERFMERYDPSKLELATRDYISRCILKEVKEGRGSIHGGAWLSVAHLPPRIIEDKLPTMLEKFAVAGIDIRKEPMAVRWMNHYQNGGIRVDEQWATRIKGLYAVGEAAGGPHGANRLGSNSLPDLIVSGKRAGEAAALYSREEGSVIIPSDQVDVELQIIEAPLGNRKGDNPYELRDLVSRTMNEYLDIARNRDGIENALEIFEEVAGKLPLLKIGGSSLKFNRDWEAAMELRSRVLAGEIIARTSLFREESRAGLYREDFPMTDRNRWDCNVAVSRGKDGRIQLEKVPLVASILDIKEVELPSFPVAGK